MAATRNRAKVEESGIHEEIGGSSQGKIPVGVKSERRRLLICQNARSEREPGGLRSQCRGYDAELTTNLGSRPHGKSDATSDRTENATTHKGEDFGG